MRNEYVSPLPSSRFEAVTRAVNPQQLITAMSANGVDPALAAQIGMGEWGRIMTLGSSWHPLLFDDPIRYLQTRGLPQNYSMAEIGCATALHLAYSETPPENYLGYDYAEHVVLAANAVQGVLRDQGLGSENWRAEIGNLLTRPETSFDIGAAILFAQYNGAEATVRWVRQAGRLGIVGDAIHGIQLGGERIQLGATVEIQDHPECDQPTGIKIEVGDFIDESLLGKRYHYQLTELGDGVQRIPLAGRSDAGILTVFDFHGKPSFLLWSWNPEGLSDPQQDFLAAARQTLYEMYTRAHSVEGVGNWDGVAIAGVPREAYQYQPETEPLVVFLDTFYYGDHRKTMGPLPLTILVRHGFEGTRMAKADALSLVGDGKRWPLYREFTQELQARVLKPDGDIHGRLELGGVPVLSFILP